MTSENPAIEQFVKTWIAEFGRAVEMFTGQQSSLSFSTAEAPSIPKTTSALWLKQIFSGESDFQVWVGAQDATWMELGKALGDGPVENLRSTYLEIINQAHQGAAAVTTFGLTSAIQCETAETLPATLFDPVSFSVFDVEWIDAEHPPLVVAIERTAPKAPDTAPVAKPEKEHAPSELNKLAPTDLRGIVGLSLPVSVSLGSAKLEIRNVLRARAGSRIQLFKDMSDPVELLVDGTIVARGELVIVKGNYGFRVKQIVTKGERVSLCAQ